LLIQQRCLSKFFPGIPAWLNIKIQIKHVIVCILCSQTSGTDLHILIHKEQFASCRRESRRSKEANCLASYLRDGLDDVWQKARPDNTSGEESAGPETWCNCSDACLPKRPIKPSLCWWSEKKNGQCPFFLESSCASHRTFVILVTLMLSFKHTSNINFS